MPQIILDVPPNLDQAIREKAAANGVTVDKYLVGLAARDQSNSPRISYEDFLARTKELEAFLEKLPSLRQPHRVDDSRESIY
jgi:hypothetical protein